MITDRELDAQLAGAAGVRDADLPALPEDFLALVRADAAGGSTGGGASLIAARQLVDDAREARTAVRPRRRRPGRRTPGHGTRGRRTVVRIGVAVVTVAAAWTTAVAVAPTDGPSPRDGSAAPIGTPGPVGTPTAGIRLVAAEQVTVPVSLDPVPEGLTPTFSRRGGVAAYGDGPVVFTADHSSPEGDRVLVNLFPDDPRGLPEMGWSDLGTPAGTATVDGAEAEVKQGDGFVTLLWERPDGRWVWVLGEGAYGDRSAAVAVAGTLVDRPRPVGLQFGLAPAGWSVGGYEESRSLDLVSDTDPQQLLRLSVVGREGGATPDGMLEGVPLAAPVTTVTVQGQEGRLALVQGDAGQPDYWYLVGQLPDGPLFLLLAPQTLTQEQVLEIAGQVTYTP